MLLLTFASTTKQTGASWLDALIYLSMFPSQSSILHQAPTVSILSRLVRLHFHLTIMSANWVWFIYNTFLRNVLFLLQYSAAVDCWLTIVTSSFRLDCWIINFHYRHKIIDSQISYFVKVHNVLHGHSCCGINFECWEEANLSRVLLFVILALDHHISIIGLSFFQWIFPV